MTLDYFNQARKTAQESGDRIGSNFNAIDQSNKIEQILSDVISSQNPQESMNNAMSQILSQVDPDRQPAAIKYIESIGQQMDNKRQRQGQIEAGYNPNLPESVNKMQMENQIKQQNNQQVLNSVGGKDINDLSREELTPLLDIPQFSKQAQQRIKDLDKADLYYNEKEEKVAPIKSALSTTKELKDVLDNNYYSYGPLAGRLNQSANAREARQQITTLGNSLLSIAFMIPVRNQREFDAALASLTDPKSSYSKNMGAVKALEKILNGRLESELGSDIDNSGEVGDVGGKDTKVIDQETVNEMFK